MKILSFKDFGSFLEKKVMNILKGVPKSLGLT
jgi:hypothetical protein